MRVFSILLFAVVVLGPSWARADGGRRAQVAAATADALHTLEADVLSASVTPDFTVEQFVDRTGSREALARMLRGAEQIGGTRWLDDQTCQVRMEVSGGDVADMLLDVARAKPREAGLPADVLRRRMDRLRDMTFAATGMSTSAADRLRPSADDPAWRGVSDRAVQAAVSDARRNAARQLLDAVEPIEMSGGGADKTRLEQVLKDQRVHDAVEGWIMKRPVTSVVFQPDLEVRVAVAADGDSFWDQLAAAAADRKDLPFPHDDKAREALRREVVKRVEPTVGRAIAKAGAVQPGDAPPAVAAAVDIPRDPPAWVVQQVDARGTSRAVDGRLKTARAAESAARDRLRDQVDKLQLSRQLTLGDAARRDPRVRTAIDRAVDRARPRKVNYLADGGAEVTFTLDLRDVWYEIAER